MNIRDVMKAAARGAAHVVVSPLLVSFAIRGRLLGRDRALEASTQWLSLVPGVTGEYLRRAYLSHTIAACHETAVVGFGTTFSRCGARIDANVYVGPGGHLGLVHIERDVLVAAGVHIPSGSKTHRIDDPAQPIREQANGERLVRIGAGCWIGEAAVVMADVGRDTVVGAGSVVTRPLPARCIAAGVPARVLRMRDAPARAV
jgi:virginiamycin A acetyltransferase